MPRRRSWSAVPAAHRDPAGRPARRVRAAGRTAGALVSVGLLVLAGYYWYTFRDIERSVPRLGKVAIGAPPPGRGDIDGMDQNILLVGNDDRDNMTDAEVRDLHVGRDGGSKATDTMMILHVPADGSRATMISLPRDSYVQIPGFGTDRLNAAYVDGYNAAHGNERSHQTAGADLLLRTVTRLTGLTINHYVQVSLLGFYDISKAIGGVPITLCHDVDDSRAANQAAGLDGGSGFKMSKGRHTISGRTALEFVRQRHFLDGGDLDRVRRQQYFLTAAFRQVAGAGVLFELNSLGTALKRDFVLDDALDLVELARQMQHLSADNIVGRVIPTRRAKVDGMDVLAVDPAAVQSFVRRVIGRATPSTPAAGSPGRPPVSTRPLDRRCIN